MDKLKMATENITEQKINEISKLFPNVIVEGINKNGKKEKLVDFETLKQELSSIVSEDDNERYIMNWPGKKQAILTANASINATLRPCRAESVDFDNSKNLYIEGDNLDVLKLLRETYLNKVRMIYIDPPYNTGNDFIYDDDFSISVDDYVSQNSLYDDQGNRLFVNNDTNGRFHSDWLSMIYSRIKIARDFLTEDGGILISIDDNEIVNLRKVCDEIFGEKNFVCTFVWQKAFAPKNDNRYISTSHEYIVLYAKNKELYKRNLIPRTNTDGYSNPDNDPRGLWTSGTALAISFSQNAVFPFTAPNGKVHMPPEGRCWRYSKETFDQLIKENRMWFGKDGNGVPRVKRFLSEMPDGVVPQSLLKYEDVGSGQDGTQGLKQIFDNALLFDFPKPIKLLRRLLTICSDKDSIVLDFFSGSATTAHALLEQNAEDGGNRRFILVQIPEKCVEGSVQFKAGYKNICEIGKERIRRAGKKVLEDYPNANIDLGFRDLKLDTSNMKEVYYNPEEVTQSLLSKLEDNIKEDRTSEDLLFQVMLDMGVELSSDIKTEIKSGKTVYNVNDGNLVCCFDKNLTNEVVTEIAKMQPLYAVFRDSSMASDSTNVNFEQIFETYSPTTKRKVL